MLAQPSLVDLHWLLLSPPLLADGLFQPAALAQQFSDDERMAVQNWLAQLALDPTPWHAYWVSRKDTLDLRRLPLGRYAEHLMCFYLTHGPVHRLVDSHIALRSDRVSRQKTDHTTLGEIDFLLTDGQSQCWHWELAVKYFLCHATSSPAQPQDCKGPQAQETFDQKIAKLQKQLAQPMPQPHCSRTWQAAAYTRGWMFYRWGLSRPTCNWLHPDHLFGWWLPLHEMPLLGEAGFERWRVLERFQWMGAAQSDHCPDMNVFQLQQALAQKAPQPVLVQANSGETKVRFFVITAPQAA